MDRASLDNLISDWPTIPRLTESLIVTEKLDGVFGKIHISDYPPSTYTSDHTVTKTPDGRAFIVTAATRDFKLKHDTDYFGFREWVYAHAQSLAMILGPGDHFGEWWGGGIRRGYGLPDGDRRFSLFDFNRWSSMIGQTLEMTEVDEIRVVPIITTLSSFDSSDIHRLLDLLRRTGSYAEVGYKPAEGVVIYNTDGLPVVKAVLKDDRPKLLDKPAIEDAVRRAMERRAQYA